MGHRNGPIGSYAMTYLHRAVAPIRENWGPESADDHEPTHGPRCSANPEIGCVCGDDAGDRPFAWANARDLSVSDDEAAAFAAEMRTR